MAEAGLDAILITSPENSRYLSGFVLMPGEEKVAGHSGQLLITHERAIILLDFRYLEQAASEVKDFELYQVKGKLAGQWGELLGLTGVKRIGFESWHLTFGARQELASAVPDIFLIPTENWVEDFRIIKDAEELRFLERACRLADQAFLEAINLIHPGFTEKQIAWELESRLRKGEAEGIAFELLVLAGAHSSLVHGRPSSKRWRKGEQLLIDFGVIVGGYHTDCTRMVFAGSPHEKQTELYNLIFQAQSAALEAIRPGMSGIEADRVARQIIEEAGYGEAFGHGLGHGVGLATHEKPGLNTVNEDVLEEGMVFTIEPGIYLPGWGGTRLEDMVVLEKEGPRRLSGLPREMFCL